jgi:hypothetical protein
VVANAASTVVRACSRVTGEQGILGLKEALETQDKLGGQVFTRTMLCVEGGQHLVGRWDGTRRSHHERRGVRVGFYVRVSVEVGV